LDTNVAWVPLKNVFTTNANASFNVPANDSAFYRAVGFDLLPGRAGFTNLTRAYSLLTAVAGAGGIGTDGVNKWLPEFEGGPATNALLSRPHMAQADAAGNIYIADKDGHAIRKVLTNGVIITVAGVNSPGNGPDELTPATEAALWEPNGLFTKADGTTYILDLQNGKIRRLDTNGMMQTIVTVPGGILAGRGLWVNDDETLLFISSLNQVLRWDSTNGLAQHASGFTELGNLTVDPWGQLVVTDRSAHRVYRVNDLGESMPIAGNGSTSGGGDGQLALDTGLNEVRGVWFLPTGAYFVCTHRGSQVWYVDTGGFIHLFLHGLRSDTHAGDGTYFYNPTEPRVSEIRAVALDFEGNLLITENDSGFVRKVQFLRYTGTP
jgi:sugar lactone lactonase YvrE